MNHYGKFFTALASAVATAALLSACGGGDAGAPFSSTASIGYAVDGYLKDASVKCDASGVVVLTDSSGFFRFPDGCSSGVTLTGGTNVDTLLPFTGTLKAPAGSKMVTPLTTLLVGGMTQSQVNASLGLPADTDLTNTDPAFSLLGILVHPDLLKKTLAVQQFAQKLTETFAGLAASGGDAAKPAIYSEVAVAMAQALTANTAFVSGGTISESVAAAVSKAVVERVKAATTLPAAVIQGVTGLNSDTFAQVVAGALKFHGDAILSAANSSVISTTKTQLQNTAITTFIQTNKAGLTGVPSNATAALGVQLAQALTGNPGTGNATNLVTNGDFSNGTTGWSGNAASVQTAGGNSYNFANVATAGNAFDVNLSYVLNIPTSGVGYKLRFKASSDRARTMVAGIGLNQDPWTNVTQAVNLTTTQQTFELSLTSNFASATSRVIFDMGAAVGTVVIDDVELLLDTPPVATNLVTNGDFSNGTTGWSGNAASVQTAGGNSYNFANVATAGNAFDVNLSYVLNIPTSGVGYKLRFKASSDRARTMVAGIGLNQDPWTNVTQAVNLTTTQQTFELSLTSNFASATSRVIFDMGAAVGTVVIDDVELLLDTPTAPAPAGGPTVAASAPTALAANVKSIFSDSYTNVAVGAWGPDWGPASARITDGVIAGNNYKTIDMAVAGQEFAGISFISSKFDATAYTTFNIDYWIDTPLPAGQVINIKLSNHDGSGETSAIQYLVNPVTGGSWQRLSIPFSSFTVAGGGSSSRNNIAEIIITAARANTALPVKVYFDNMYFSQPAPAPVATNLVTNGDFSNGTTGWSGNAASVQTAGGNSYNFANVATAGNAFDVNLSYVLNIPTSGVGYKLRFKASSDRARTMVAGIGLNQDPWTNVTQAVNLTTTQQTFELSLTSNFASATSRVIFDMGAAVGTVVIDDVELLLDTPTAPAPAGGPTVAASAPTALAANVKSIFSDSYTNVAVGAWGPDWGPASARITDGVIAGNNYKTIDMAVAGQEFAGISFISSKFDATAYTTFNIDYWIDTPLPAGQVINIKLSNHDGSGETSAIQYLVNPVTGGSWQRLSIPFSSFTVAGGGSSSRNNIAEIIITAARANTALPVKVYFDNMYFSQ